MKALVTGMVVFFLGLMAASWVAAERAGPVFLTAPGQPERSEGVGSGAGSPSFKIGLAPGELQTLVLPEVPAAAGQAAARGGCR